jgi:hypothetical protein
VFEILKLLIRSDLAARTSWCSIAGVYDRIRKHLMQSLARPLLGKTRSKLKSAKTTFAADRVVLSTESHEEFRLLRESYFAQFEPKNFFEEMMVDDIVVAKWRYLRIVRIRAALLEMKAAERDASLAWDYQEVEETAATVGSFSRLADSIKAQHTSAIRRFGEERRHPSPRPQKASKLPSSAA